MKRSHGSSDDSLGVLMSICPEGENQTHDVYTREFQTMLDGLDEEGCVEESGHQKKRRLSVEQVKALEKYFEVENKLEPERKVKLAQELGLQPRQVAVWFQNRRARWKTKQLERDYGVLKASYDSLKLDFDTVKQDNETLLKQVREMKAQLQDENGESKLVMKEEEEEEIVSEDEKETCLVVNSTANCDEETTELNFESFNGVLVFADTKDGSSDSDTSAILNEEPNNNNNNNSNSPNAAISSPGVDLQSQSPTRFLISQEPSSSSPLNACGGSSSGFRFLGPAKEILEEEDDDAHRGASYQPQHFVKIEEHNFFSGDDSCTTTFFSDDQAPSLHWYNPDEWN